MPQITDNPRVWHECIERLQQELSAEEVNTWIMPLHTHLRGHSLRLLAPNRYVLDYVRANLFEQVERVILAAECGIRQVILDIGSYATEQPQPTECPARPPAPHRHGVLSPEFTFAKHVEGKSNEIARAGALRVAKNPGTAYNPLCIYGDVGLGKTHLMQAVGNHIKHNQSTSQVAYVHSEIFVNDMVKAIMSNSMNKFKRYYRSQTALLIDDFQFFAKKVQSQEEFFHTFNTMLEDHRQIIITCDRIPQSLTDVTKRLISRVVSGLVVSIDPPELETRIAIVQNKAASKGIDLPDAVATFIANTAHSNVRDLEGALNQVSARAQFTGRPVDVELAREALQDIVGLQQKRNNIENIQNTVARHCGVRVAELRSKSRVRAVVRPRQLAMYFAKDLTALSLQEIGERFGGRDHTTVLHACRTIASLLQTDERLREDYQHIRRQFAV